MSERLDRGAWSWALFEWARNPYVILCGIYVFAPYVTNIVVGDPVRGQVALAGWHTIAGVTVALTAPFLGAAADSMRRRKPLLAAILAVMIPAVAIQWFALPEGGLPLWGVGAAIVVAGICFAWTEVLHNAMITTVTPPKLVPAVSGLGLSLGNAAGVLLLVFVLLTIALPGTVLPGEPLFGLDPAKHEPARSVTVICALWLFVFSAPLFLYSPDGGAGAGAKLGAAVASGARNVTRTIGKLWRDYRNVGLFLMARMFYADGTTAILIFSGAYASGVMGWDLLEMLLYGISLSIVAISGGFVGAWLEGAIGSKNAVAVLIGTTLLCLVAMVSMATDAILFMPASSAPVWDGPVFQSAPELAYLGASMLIAISITGAISSGRSLMAKLCPPGMEGELFGLYALSNAATVWLGPMLVEHFTEAYESQRVGFAAVSILLAVGFTLLLFVKAPVGERA